MTASSSTPQWEKQDRHGVVDSPLAAGWTTGGGKCPTVILKLVSGESIVSIIMLVSLCACPFSETIVFDD